MFADYVLNGQAYGEVGQGLEGIRYEPWLRRPYKDRDGHIYVTTINGYDHNGKPELKQTPARQLIYNGYDIPVSNATTLRKEEWALYDRAVVKAARQRLRAWSDLAASNTFGGFNGMAKMLLEHETMSDPGEAQVDMDGISTGRGDAPLYQLEGLPLPITHSDFSFSERRLAASRSSGTPLDVTQAEAAGRRVAEKIEQTTIGMITGITYSNTTDGGYSQAPTVYGYTNHPDRLTKTDLTTPDGTNGASTVDDVLEMIEDANDHKFFGPFMLYHSTDWDKYMDDDYRANDSRTLRQRLRAIDAIQDVRRLDFLTSTFTLLLVQMTSEVARAVVGMDLVTVQWPTKGGMQMNFKVMAIMVPQLRSDYYGNMGMVHGTTA